MSMWTRSSHTLPPSLTGSHWVSMGRYVLNTTCPHLQLILQNLPVEGLQRELSGQGTKPEQAWLYREIKAQVPLRLGHIITSLTLCSCPGKQPQGVCVICPRSHRYLFAQIIIENEATLDLRA